MSYEIYENYDPIVVKRRFVHRLRNSICTAFRTDKGLYILAGCFFGLIEKFKEAVQKTHGVSGHGMDYADWIYLVERWDARRKIEEEGN
jgi:hypothetical protein